VPVEEGQLHARVIDGGLIVGTGHLGIGLAVHEAEGESLREWVPRGALLLEGKLGRVADLASRCLCRAR